MRLKPINIFVFASIIFCILRATTSYRIIYGSFVIPIIVFLLALLIYAYIYRNIFKYTGLLESGFLIIVLSLVLTYGLLFFFDCYLLYSTKNEKTFLETVKNSDVFSSNRKSNRSKKIDFEFKGKTIRWSINGQDSIAYGKDYSVNVFYSNGPFETCVIKKITVIRKKSE